MPDGKKKMISSKETGTVPKVKYWNNTGIQHDAHHVANNLTSSMLPTQERHLDSRNRQRCSNYHCFEDIFTDDSRVVPNYNSLPYINMSGGTTSPSTSGSTSRRHSGTSGGAIRKCDNITKYPDKKHIEDKLNQIREYLKVTSSLMSSVKEDQSNADEHGDLLQMLTALRDSEKKLETLLVDKEASEQQFRRDAAAAQIECTENGVPTLDTDPAFQTFQNNVSSERNELEQKMEINEKKLHALHEHQSLLMRLQEKAENQLKDARKAQERLAAAANVQHQNQNQNQEMKNSENEKNRTFDIEMHQDQLGLLHSTNEGRGQLLRLLDARDNELCSEQQALQDKMQELNSKKLHIDQLVSQLHSYGQDCEEGDDMANQIRQIVAMKEQLATLKDMLSAVKSTEAQLLHQNSVERSESGEQLPVIKSGNVTKSSSAGLSDSEWDRRWNTMGKQSNKSSISSSREQLQAELQAKKQELEELMYKDQDRTSAINQDVCNELVMNKAEQSFSVESVPSSWTLLQDSTPPRETSISRENVYSSDEEELENYSQLNNCNFVKQIPNRHVLNCNPTIGESASTPSVNQSFNLNQQWSGVDHKQQLELMTNLCQSLLEQQRQVMPNQCNAMNVQWYSSYMQMQQALMLSTISQCCQLLWQQQQDINSLISTVSLMQEQRSKPPSTHNLSPPTNETQTVGTGIGIGIGIGMGIGGGGSGSACSLPTRLPSNNTEYASLASVSASTSRGRHSPQVLAQTQAQVQVQAQVQAQAQAQNLTRNIPVVPVNVMSQTHPHPLPHPPVWTGVQALNNQVAPGNRANNYWDNFRSYSRQNLLSTSTKSNEGSQNSLPMFDRSIHQPLSQQRSHSHTLPKINIPIHEGVPSLDLNNHDETSERATNRGERSKPAKRNRASCRNRNEWNEETPQPEDSPQKSKLFHVLRENVYKEVTLLISANENRPHFLIQLFRDLQLISSDPLRRSALHSIQSLISRSLNEATPANVPIPVSVSVPVPVPVPVSVSVQCPSGLEQCTENGISTPSRNKSGSTRCCPQSSVSTTMENIKLDLSAQRILMDLLSFLRSHNEDTFNNNLIDVVKKMILDQCKPSGCNNKLQAKLDLLLNEYLSKYKGKRVMDIKEDLLKTIADVLLDEILAIEMVNEPKQKAQVLQETQHKPLENNIPNANSLLFLGEHNYTLPLETFQFLQLDQKGRPNFSNVPRVDNGDLAEADQSRRDAENDEGAVGGLLPNASHVDGANNETNMASASNELHPDLEMFINPDLNN